jgi:uncharacterized membrane protein YeaQ/YmgE (transglycosylase-associated protein family)
MNIFIWIVAGGTLGWAGYRFWGYNEQRAPFFAILIGAVGGFFGGHVIAPMFLSAAAVPGNFNSPALFFAAAIAASFLFVGSMIHDRWGV